MHRAPYRAGRMLRAIGVAVLGPLTLILFAGLLFGDELAGGPLAYGPDTTVFYYPLTEWMTGEIRAGRLPLWIPLIFGGYPLLADGEVGPLYPPNLVLLAPFSMSQAYAAMRTLHFAVAAVGLYGLARALGAGRFGAVIGGLAFGYGSFMVGHLEHDNILRSAAWLPWLLLAAELALRRTGPRRAVWALAGALVLALQCLGLHIQPVLLSLLALGAYLVVGPLGAPGGGLSPPLREEPASRSARRSGIRALLPRATIGAAIVGLGFGLAAMQLVPLYLLGQRSVRPSLVTYDYATSYAVSPPQLLTLLFPYMFHFDAQRSWALWSPHESTLYVGVAPLVLALIAVAFLRTRAACFFGVLAAVSLILALGDYLPIKPYAIIWNLPGFVYLRAPARFGLLFELALACLAALAIDWLARRARAEQAPRGLVGLLTGLSLSAVGLALLLQGLRWWLQHDPEPALEAFRLSLQTSKENWLLGAWHVYYGLLEFSRPDNVRTALGIVLLATVPLLLRAWLARPGRELIWRTALLGLVGLDLWLFAGAFHPRAHPEQQRPTSPAIGQLAGQPGPFRVFIEPDLNPSLGPNQLVRNGLATVNGYSSLEPRRFSEYWWSIVAQDNVLLDLFNVRYVLAARRPPAGQRTFEGTGYHPADRLMSGQADNRSGVEEFRAPPGRVESVTVVAAVEGLREPAAGTPVAELTLRGADGTSRSLTLRAGVEVGDYRAAAAGRPTAEYVGPRVVWAGPSFEPGGRDRESAARLYGATLPVSPPIDATSVTVHALTTTGRFHLHGLGLRDAEGAVATLRSSDKAKYRLLYADGDVLLLENTAAWPRVFAVDGALPVEAGATIPDQLLGRSWDPGREILVEGLAREGDRDRDREELGAVGAGPAPGPAPTAPSGRAELLAYEPGRVVARAELPASGFLVLAERFEEGWRAWSETRELPILRANGVEQAVALPAGTHTVTFVYDPWWVRLGFALSGMAALAFVAGLGAALGGLLAARRQSADG